MTELRKTNNQIVNELDEFKRQNSSLKGKVDILEKDTENRIRADSNAEIASQTENMKLRLRINELQEQLKDHDYYLNQLKTIKEENNSFQIQIREQKSKNLDIEGENSNLRKEAHRSYNLQEEN